MPPNRRHSTRLALVRYLDGAYWEEWHFRFNIGDKQRRPVKFFAHLTWRSDPARQLTPFSGTRWSYGSQKEAEQHFADTVAAHGGTVVSPSVALDKDLKARFGYAPYISKGA